VLTKLNLADLWAAESTHALTLSASGRRRVVAPANETCTRFCVQMLYSSLYANSATEHTPALADIQIDGDALDLTCPLCGTADSDTKHHLFHECAETRGALDTMQEAIVAAIHTASGGAITALAALPIASAATSRPDFFAGQIPRRAHDLILAARRAAGTDETGGQCTIPLPGAIQQLILKHCYTVHMTRKKCVDAEISTADHRCQSSHRAGTSRPTGTPCGGQTSTRQEPRPAASNRRAPATSPNSPQHPLACMPPSLASLGVG
jgi:hypothetical protein